MLPPKALPRERTKRRSESMGNSKDVVCTNFNLEEALRELEPISGLEGPDDLGSDHSASWTTTNSGGIGKSSGLGSGEDKVGGVCMEIRVGITTDFWQGSDGYSVFGRLLYVLGSSAVP